MSITQVQIHNNEEKDQHLDMKTRITKTYCFQTEWHWAHVSFK